MAYDAKKPALTFLKLLRMTPWRLTGMMGMNFLKALCLLLSPLVLAETIRIAEQQPDNATTYLMLLLGGYILVLFSNIPLHTLYIRFASKATRDMELRLRAVLVRRLQHLSMRFHGDRESGRLQSKVLRDVEELIRMAEVFFNVVIGGAVMFLWAVGVALVRDWKIALAFIIISPLAILLIQGFRAAMRKRNSEYRRQIESMSQRVTEMIDMVPVTRAHGAEEFEIDAIEDRLRDVHFRGRRVDQINAIFAASSFVTFHVSITLILAVCTLMVLNGMMSLDKIALYHGLFAMLVAAVSQITSMIPQFSKSIESVRSLGEVLECPDFEENQNKEAVHAVRGEIEFHKVSFRYSDTSEHAIEEFSFRAVPGDCVAVVGESGSGKSTLMQLTIGFLRPQKGEILLDDRPMRDLDMRTYRRRIAMVPQHTILFSGTIRENITYGLKNYTEDQVWAAIDAAFLREVIQKLPDGLDTRVGEQGFKLSGGQRQRLAIARALIRDPRVIILDEATSALDVISEKEVQNAIDNLVRGRTTFIVAHRLSTIRQANKVIVMKEGRAVEVGEPEELMRRNGEFARLKALQA